MHTQTRKHMRICTNTRTRTQIHINTVYSFITTHVRNYMYTIDTHTHKIYAIKCTHTLYSIPAYTYMSTQTYLKNIHTTDTNFYKQTGIELSLKHRTIPKYKNKLIKSYICLHY